MTDEDKKVYMLGLRDMCNKSSQTTLDTFKEILSDISDLCACCLDECEISYGNQILCNIRNFMSDRAKTNIAFTDLLVDYRKEIVPQNIDSWHELGDDKKKCLLQSYQLFLRPLSFSLFCRVCIPSTEKC